MKKKAYTQPQLTVHGNVEILTQGTKSGLNLDSNFALGTPLDSVTLS